MSVLEQLDEDILPKLLTPPNAKTFLQIEAEQNVWPGHNTTNSVFSDPIWKFPATLDGGRRITIRFANIQADDLVFAKTLCYCLLNVKPNASTMRLSPKATKEAFACLYSFYTDSKKTDSQTLQQWLENLTPSDVASQLSTPKSTQRLLLATLNRLPLYAKYLPVPETSAATGFQVASGKKDENTTKKIPSSTVQPLLEWCFAYIEQYAPGILLAADNYRKRASNQTGEKDNSRVKQWIQDRERERQGVPTASGLVAGAIGKTPELGAVSYKDCAFLMGVPKESLYAQDKQRLHRLAEYSFTEYLGLGVDINGNTWRPPMNASDVEREVENLRTAALIVIGFLTGMRPSEYIALQRGCSRVEGDKVFLEGRVQKARGVTSDRKETWVTIPLVHRAIGLLESLASSSWLFDSVSYLPASRPMTTSSANKDISRFIERCNELHLVFGTGPIIPTDEPIKPSSFRPTLAWYIASQPYGVIAGMLQYKHLQVTTFEGYAGTKDAGLQESVKQASKKVAEVRIRERYEEFKQGASDLLSANLVEKFTHFQQETDDFPGMVVDSKRLETLLKLEASNVYSGTLNDCHFDPSKALCKPTDAKVFEAPLLASCKLLSCDCSSIDSSKAEAWKDKVNRLDALLQNDTLSQFQRDYVCQRATSAKQVVATLASLRKQLKQKEQNERID